MKSSTKKDEITNNYEMIRVIAVCFFSTGKIIKFFFLNISFISSFFCNKGLAWLFGFLVIIPSSVEYLEFIFSLIFCILNAFQGFYIFVSSILIKKFMNVHLKYIQKARKNKLSISSSNIGLSFSHQPVSVTSTINTMISYIDDKTNPTNISELCEVEDITFENDE